MGTSGFLLGSEQFSRIFPFHFVLNSDLIITSYGKSIAKLCPIKEGELFSDLFNFRLPQMDYLSFHSLKSLTDKVVQLELSTKDSLTLRGQFEFLEAQNQVIFIGTPCFGSMEQVKNRQLSLNDFARHDNLVDQLYLRSKQEDTNKGILNLLDTVSPSKKILKADDTLLKFALKKSGLWYYDVANPFKSIMPPVETNEPGGEFAGIDFEKWRAGIHPVDRVKLEELFNQLKGGKGAEFEEPHRWHTGDNAYKTCTTRAFIADRDAAGNAKMIVGIITPGDVPQPTMPDMAATRLSFLIQNLDSAIVVESKEQKITMVNDKFCNLLGIKEKPEELVGMNYTAATRQSRSLYKNPDAVITKIYQLLEKKQPERNELIALADGRYFKRDFIPIYTDGSYDGHIWQYSDVTDQTIGGRRLEDQKQFYESVLNYLPAEIVVYNPNHEYMFVNPGAVPDEQTRTWMIGRKDEEYWRRVNRPDHISAERKAAFDEVMATHKVKLWEEVTEGHNEQTQYRLRSLYPIINAHDEIGQIIGFGLDITDRKHIEEQLKLNEKRYRDLFSYSQAFICTHDLSGRILTVNPAICELLALKENELIGRMLADFLPEQDVKNFYSDYLARVINEGTAKGVFSVVSKNGKKSFLLYKNFKLQEENSEPYIIGFSQDITDRIQTEKELLETKKVTENAHRAKEIFLANMSHEIRTPMTGILGIANLLSKTTLDSQQQKFTKLISESANNLLTIVNDVLDIEKIAAGRLDLENIPFKLEDKVFTTLQSFQFKAEDKNINLLLNSTLPDDMVVVGDPYRLGQILNNLLSNALKFTQEGEISINMDYHAGDNNKMIVDIAVQDTGIGIKPEKLSDIFIPFVQASSDTTRKYGGTGLGLTICRNLVEMQGGSIKVVSEVAKGTTFSFNIVYEKGNLNMLPQEHKEDINFKDLESVRILVAEDVELNQFLVKHILDSWGCDVTIVNNGKEAVDIVKKQYFDLILMDIQMPEMDGITATKMIRGLNISEKPLLDKSLITKKIRTLNAKDKSNIPIIALTANALKGDGQRYMDIGMNGYITKPYTEEKLFTVINDVIKANDKLRFKLNPQGKVIAEALPVPEVSPLLYDLTLINTIGKDDINFAKRIVSIFLETMPESLDNLTKVAAEHNWEQISKTAHKMKSSIDSMGIESIKETIRDLEGVTPGSQSVDLLIQKVTITLKEVFIQLEEFVKQ